MSFLWLHVCVTQCMTPQCIIRYFQASLLTHSGGFGLETKSFAHNNIGSGHNKKEISVI